MPAHQLLAHARCTDAVGVDIPISWICCSLRLPKLLMSSPSRFPVAPGSNMDSYQSLIYLFLYKIEQQRISAASVSIRPLLAQALTCEHTHAMQSSCSSWRNLSVHLCIAFLKGQVYACHDVPQLYAESYQCLCLCQRGCQGWEGAGCSAQWRSAVRWGLSWRWLSGCLCPQHWQIVAPGRS